MRFSERWLRTMVDPQRTSEALAELLTMAGLEVEAREPAAATFTGVVVARIAAVERHPGAERLAVCRVETGSETLQVVCGAPNVQVGMLVACARPGARLPGMSVKPVELRGVQSSGMLCSARELGLGEDHSGLLELGQDAELGADLRVHLELDDWLVTLKLTPNRGDCLSILGLAREVSALTGERLCAPPEAAVPAAIATQRAIELVAPDACPRYCGRVIEGVEPKATTPDWMRGRLERCGVRSISALVDITNYVMLELGQPLHAFDHAKLDGDILVRFAEEGERLTLLDGREVTLDPGHLLIADARQALALAGVMGGAGSAVSDATRAVFLESAFFDPATVARASRGLEIASDAAHRFERGVDFALARRAIERASALVLEICGGHAGPVTETLAALPARASVRLRGQRARSLLGIELEDARMQQIFEGLGMQARRHGVHLLVTPPSYRFDIEIEEDLVEEIARVHGYDAIPAVRAAAPVGMLPLAETRVPAARIKDTMAARDYLEVVTFSFVDRELEADFAGSSASVALLNPIASSMSVMRSTLLGSLAECARYNTARKQERVRIFELAACFRRDGGGGYEQTERVAGLCLGSASPEQWGMRSRPVDFFDVRGDLEALLGRPRLQFQPGLHPALHPGQAARVLLDGVFIGWLGALHPRLLQKYELGVSGVCFELEVALLQGRSLPSFHPVPRFQPVRRDIALVVDKALLAAQIESHIFEAGAPLVRGVTLFDLYTGEGVPAGRKSLAFRVLLQDTEKTLTDSEVEAQIQQVLRFLEEKHGATIRT